MDQRVKKIILIFITIVFFILVYFIGVKLSRAGETKLTITAAPSSSKILINGENVNDNTVFLSPGTYKISASLDGFTDDTKQVDINDKDQEVYLLPEPSTQEARNWLAENPDIQREREAVGGLETNKRGLELEDKNPIISHLPISDISGLFTIDYGPSQERENGIFLIITTVSPKGRLNALKWIRQNGQDPTNLDIQFADFKNPLVTNSDTESEYYD